MVTSEAMLRYVNSDKGKATRAAYIARNAEKVRDYMKDFSRNRRRDLFRRGLCIRCGHKKSAPNRVQCQDCLDKLKKGYEMRKVK